ncbi:hypothetical protein EDB85DRAFT_2204859 [Lactarius pseudohatsudake]|nr:hypothetical protein EDB85DRAFT_2204859 [Lactarius pseudohatsudake]
MTSHDLVELKSTLAHTTPRLSTHHRGHNESVIRQIEMMDQAHLKRKKAETTTIIAAAAAAQKAEEQCAVLEAAAVTEAQSKEEERKAECEWRWKEWKEREDGAPVGRRGASGEDSRRDGPVNVAGKYTSKYHNIIHDRLFRDLTEDYSVHINITNITYVLADERSVTIYRRESDTVNITSRSGYMMSDTVNIMGGLCCMMKDSIAFYWAAEKFHAPKRHVPKRMYAADTSANILVRGDSDIVARPL